MGGHHNCLTTFPIKMLRKTGVKELCLLNKDTFSLLDKEKKNAPEESVGAFTARVS